MFISASSSLVRTVVGTAGMAICASACLLAATAPAHADTVRTTTVRVADLDLSSAAGRATFDRRVQHAARVVCVSAEAGPVAFVEEDRCIRRAVAAVRPSAS